MQVQLYPLSNVLCMRCDVGYSTWTLDASMEHRHTPTSRVSIVCERVTVALVLQPRLHIAHCNQSRYNRQQGKVSCTSNSVSHLRICCSNTRVITVCNVQSGLETLKRPYIIIHKGLWVPCCIHVCYCLAH